MKKQNHLYVGDCTLIRVYAWQTIELNIYLDKYIGR